MTEKRLERNNKERLKNNILIKIEFWDTGGIVKWYCIMIKWLFGMVNEVPYEVSSMISFAVIYYFDIVGTKPTCRASIDQLVRDSCSVMDLIKFTRLS